MIDLQNKLTQIGFTEYEAKVYLTLLRENPATGYQVSKTSGVPRSMVYETLGRLHGRGVVIETIEGRATLYRPLAPELLLSRHESEHYRLLTGLKEGLEELYTERLDDRVWSIEGREASLNYAANMIRQAQNELYLVIADEELVALEDEIKAACKRGLGVNTLLTGNGQLECGRVARHPPLESELQELTGTLLVAVEGAELLVANTSTKRRVRGTVTNNPDLVLIARQFVWMELFTQRIYARLGSDLLERLEPDDRQIFESLGG
jgi:Cd2+/Zn2+-exporting ATPase